MLGFMVGEKDRITYYVGFYTFIFLYELKHNVR